jgi:hypothetical protein
VHGSVLTVVGQNSLPFSIAARSLRQNSSSSSRRRYAASTPPSSKMTLFRFNMVPAPTIRVVTLSSQLRAQHSRRSVSSF